MLMLPNAHHFAEREQLQETINLILMQVLTAAENKHLHDCTQPREAKTVGDLYTNFLLTEIQRITMRCLHVGLLLHKWILYKV